MQKQRYAPRAHPLPVMLIRTGHVGQGQGPSLQGPGQGQGLDLQGQEQGQGLDSQGPGQGQGLHLQLLT